MKRISFLTIAALALSLPSLAFASTCQSKQDFLLSEGCDVAAAIPYAGYGMVTVKAYQATNGSSLSLNNPVVIVPGFNPATGGSSETDVLAIFNENGNGFIDNIRAQGRDVLLVSYGDKGYRDYIQNNAFAFVEVLNLIESYRAGSGQPVVVIGASMGGLVARYALTYMEYKSIKHNVRTYISFDTPHQGANIPLSAQQLISFLNTSMSNAQNESYKIAAAVVPGVVTTSLVTGLNLLAPLNPAAVTSVNAFAPFAVGGALYNSKELIDRNIGPAVAAAMLSNDNLDSMSARQMLISHHASGTNDPLKLQLMAELNAMGRYPKKTRNVAFTNGSVDGKSYPWPFPGNDLIVPYNASMDLGAGYSVNMSLAMNSAPVRTDAASVQVFSGSLSGPKLVNVLTNQGKKIECKCLVSAFGHCLDPGGQTCELVTKTLLVPIYIPAIQQKSYDTEVFRPASEKYSLDNAPGSFGSSVSEVVWNFNHTKSNKLNPDMAVPPGSYWGKLSFIPTYSALDLDMSKFNYVPYANFLQGGEASLKAATPFDQIYFPKQPFDNNGGISYYYGLNEPHLKITSEKLTQLVGEITTRRDLNWLMPILDALLD